MVLRIEGDESMAANSICELSCRNREVIFVNALARLAGVGSGVFASLSDLVDEAHCASATTFSGQGGGASLGDLPSMRSSGVSAKSRGVDPTYARQCLSC